MEKSRRVGEKKLLINKEESNISGVTACTINPIKYMTPAAGVGAPFNGFSSKGKLQSIFSTRTVSSFSTNHEFIKCTVA